MGVPGKRVQRVEELPDAVQEAVGHNGGPYLLDVVLESPLPGR